MSRHCRLARRKLLTRAKQAKVSAKVKETPRVARVGLVAAKASAVVPAGFAPILSYPHFLPQLAARRRPPWRRLPRKHSPGSPASGNPESRATRKIGTAPPSRSLRQGASGLMKRSYLPSNPLERGRAQNQIPVLPITATPATMESAMAVRLRALSTECGMNVDGRRRRCPELAACWLPSARSWSRNSCRLRCLDADLVSVDLERNRIAGVRGSGCHSQRGDNVELLRDRLFEFERTGERRCEPARDGTCRDPRLL